MGDDDRRFVSYPFYLLKAIQQCLDIVAISHRSQTFSPDVFTNVGIDPLAKQILVVKSMQHFHAGFAPIATRIIHMATPGALVPDFSLLPYEKVNRSIWPFAPQ